MVQPGQEAVVAVPVATLWTDPRRVRPLDAPALARPADVRGWVSSMTPEDRADLDGRTLTQLLLGERVLVEEVRDGWVRAVALEQPASTLDPRGYPGWLPADQVAAAGPGGGGVDAYVVDATATALRDEPAGDAVVTGVIMGTRLVAAGDPQWGWVPVRVPAHEEPLWARERDLAKLPAGPPTGADLLAVAERLIDVTYVWGGLSAYGIDCSGLVHLAARRFGVVLPRDAHEQAATTTPVPLGEERPGDLYFFARDGRRVHHVAFVAPAQDGTGRHLLHACGTNRRVLAEPMHGDRAETLVGAHRLPSTAA